MKALKLLRRFKPFEQFLDRTVDLVRQGLILIRRTSWGQWEPNVFEPLQGVGSESTDDSF